MNFNLIKAVATGLFFFTTSVSICHGQDLLANQAPIDKHIKVVDSVSIHRYVETKEMNINGMGLYETWNTSKTHCYSSSEVPDSFKIDLRGFAMPTSSRNVTSNFGYRPTFRRMHKGLDVKVYIGDTIYAAFDGKVRIVRYEPQGYGNYIVIRHSNGLETIYGHLSKHLVATDQEVKAGTPIGLGGNTGLSFGSHLHFETRLLGEAIDPQLIFDFPNQDVTGDFYVFHKPNNNQATHYASSTNKTKSSNRIASHFYKVKKGDNLSGIAKKLGISVKQLCAANNLRNNSKIRPKQILKY